MSTINDLLAQAVIIRDEVNPGANSALRIGNMLIDIIETMQDRTPINFVNDGGSVRLPISPLNSVVVADDLNGDEMVLVPFTLLEPLSFDEMEVRSRAGTGAASIRVGLYADSDLLPSLLLADSVVTVAAPAANTTITFEFPETQNLLAGRYWMAIQPEDDIFEVSALEPPTTLDIRNSDLSAAGATLIVSSLLFVNVPYTFPADISMEAFSNYNVSPKAELLVL